MKETLANATHAAGLTQPMTDIRDIKPLEALPAVNWLVVGLAGLALMLVLLLLWFLWQRRKQKTSPNTVPCLPAHEQAYRELDRLAAEDASGSLLDRPYYFRLSLILRTYLEARFPVRAVTMTTEELVPALRHTGIDTESIRAIQHFCHTGDRIKYAGTRQDKDTRKKDLAFVRHLVTTTREPDAVTDDMPGKTPKAQQF